MSKNPENSDPKSPTDAGAPRQPGSGISGFGILTQYPAPARVPLARNLLLVLFISFALSCKTKRRTQDTPIPASTCTLDHKKPRVLLNDMKKGEFRFTWLSAKIDCEAKFDSSDQKFDVNLRMKRDSAIWLNITDQLLGIGVARALITQDSVKFVNKLANPNECFQGDFAYISQLLNTELDFEMIQAILVGNSAAFYEDDDKLHSLIDHSNCTHMLSTIRKRRLRKVSEGQRPLKEPLQNINVDASTLKILRILFRDDETNRSFQANYGGFEAVDSLQFPHKNSFVMSDARKKASIEMRYSKVNISKPLTFPFSLPDDCVPLPKKQN